MPGIFFAAKLSPGLKFIINSSNLFTWLIGGLRDTDAMKRRLKTGYEGAYVDVGEYDEVGHHHYDYIADNLLMDVDLKGKRVLDIGCGTGIVSSKIIECGAASLVSGDQSEAMLKQWKEKSKGSNKVEFRVLDAENLSFNDDEFDIAISSMVMHLVPNQLNFLCEIKRVLKPNGIIAFSTAAPFLYSNVINPMVKVYIKKALMEMIGYRFEYWPWDEEVARNMLNKAGFEDVKTKRLTWQDEFGSSEKAWHFYETTTGIWWYDRFSKEKQSKLKQSVIDELRKQNITSIIQDAVFFYGRKP
jgi:ubiquinone/menaquinone biosynthesis C-methylase UbiE